jgi:hypothetical protein
MMYIKKFIASFVLAVICNISDVNALPNGSPVCTIGEAAVHSTHLTRATIVTGTLSLGTFQVSIGSLTLNSTVVNTIPSNTTLPVVLSSTNGTQFKGVLIVLNQPNTSLTTNLNIDPNSTDLKPQASCLPANYSGFTHTNNTLKSTANLTITLPSNQVAFLDVNVVVVNSGSTNTSIYYYTRYQLLGAAAVAPVPVPVPAAPVASVPVPVPVKAPVPVPVPVKAPTKSPTKSPTKAPVRDDCGLFRLNIFCPFTFCGIFGRLLGICKD